MYLKPASLALTLNHYLKSASLALTLNHYIKEGQSQEKHSLRVCQETSCLNHLLPDKCNPLVISKIRHPTWYLIPYNRTKHCQSFINYVLGHYQGQ